MNLISDEQQAAFDQRQREARVAQGLPETIQDRDFLRLFAAVIVAQQRRRDDRD